MLAGQDGALAVVAALLRKMRNGKGARIDVALTQSMTRFMAPRLSPHLGSGEAFTRSGGRDSVIAIYQMFETATDPINLGLGNDGIWKRFWQAVGEPEFGERPDMPATPKDARTASIWSKRLRRYWRSARGTNGSISSPARGYLPVRSTGSMK